MQMIRAHLCMQSAQSSKTPGETFQSHLAGWESKKKELMESRYQEALRRAKLVDDSAGSEPPPTGRAGGRV